VEIIRDLRLGVFDVLVGINLLREGLDIPEVSLVAVLDADKEGFLRSERSLVQTVGRAARNLHGKAILYADVVTGSMQRAIDTTEERRRIQVAFNKEHGITPAGIRKAVADIMEGASHAPGMSRRSYRDLAKAAEKGGDYQGRLARMSSAELAREINALQEKMYEHARNLEFEEAAKLRDQINSINEQYVLS